MSFSPSSSLLLCSWVAHSETMFLLVMLIFVAPVVLGSCDTFLLERFVSLTRLSLELGVHLVSITCKIICFSKIVIVDTLMTLC